MELEISLCPRCGVAPRMWHEESSDYAPHSIWCVECWKCGGVIGKTKAEAITRWNDQPYIKMLTAEIDDLKAVNVYLVAKIADLEWRAESNSK